MQAIPPSQHALQSKQAREDGSRNVKEVEIVDFTYRNKEVTKAEEATYVAGEHLYYLLQSVVQ
jgi:hypothetical protein